MKYKLVGKIIKIVKGKDYIGKYGYITYCNKCCRAYRIQFIGIGNNESYKKYKDKLILIN
jgi:hypothetical protein